MSCVIYLYIDMFSVQVEKYTCGNCRVKLGKGKIGQNKNVCHIRLISGRMLLKKQYNETKQLNAMLSTLICDIICNTCRW